MCRSDPYPIPAGVPQGSILGPQEVSPLLGGGSLSIFADDSAITYSGRVIRPLVASFQSGIDTYIKFLPDWKIHVNGSKTKTIVFPHRNSERLKPQTKIR